MKCTLNVLLVISVIVLSACGNRAETKAKEFMDAGMYEQAIVFLKDEILKSPANPELHYLLGKCYLSTDNIKLGQESFDRAIRLNPDKGLLIGRAYFEVGKKNISDKNCDSLFKLAKKYDPAIGQDIGKAYFDFATDTFYKGDLDLSNVLFHHAVDYNQSIDKEGIAKIYENKAEEDIVNGDIAELKKISQYAIKFDSKAAHTIAEKIFVNAQTIKITPDSLNRLYLFGVFATHLDDAIAKDWGSLLFKSTANNLSSIKIDSETLYLSQALEWNINIKEDILKLYFEQAENLISNKSYDIAIVVLQNAANIDKNSKYKSGNMLWLVVNEHIKDLATLGKDNFLTLMKALVDFNFQANEDDKLSYQLAEALQNYERGRREEAIFSLNSLSKQIPCSNYACQKAKEILNPPEIGRRIFRRDSLKIKPDIEGRLTYVDVTCDKITVAYSIKCIKLSGSCYLRYNSDRSPTDSPSEKNDYRLFIVDDNGNRVPSFSGFSGGNQKSWSPKRMAINLAAGEEIAAIAQFPMISLGATKIKFVSPGLPGDQNEWSTDNIALKSDPFEESLKFQPLPDDFSLPDNMSLSQRKSMDTEMNSNNVQIQPSTDNKTQPPSIDKFVQNGSVSTQASSVNKWLFPDSSSRYLTEKELIGLSKEQLWIARNEIYARNGYIFTTSKGKKFAQSLGKVYIPKSSNPSYNKFEQKNILLVREFEQKR